MSDARTHARTDTKVILYSVQCYAYSIALDRVRQTITFYSVSRRLAQRVEIFPVVVLVHADAHLMLTRFVRRIGVGYK